MIDCKLLKPFSAMINNFHSMLSNLKYIYLIIKNTSHAYLIKTQLELIMSISSNHMHPTYIACSMISGETAISLLFKYFVCDSSLVEVIECFVGICVQILFWAHAYQTRVFAQEREVY